MTIAADPDGVVARGMVRALEAGLCGTDGEGLIGEFEAALAPLFPEGHVVCANSGTAAASELYWALGFGPGDEVLLPAYGFHATLLPLLRLGVTPRFVDVSPDGTPTLEQVCDAWTSRTRALVFTHLWGPLWPLDAIAAFVHSHDGLLVADCSHSLATSSPELLAGTGCDGAFASLNHRKPIGVGEGGVSWVPSRATFERILEYGHGGVRAIRTVSGVSGVAETGLGVKSRITVVAAAIGTERLHQLEPMRQRRWSRGLAFAQALSPFGPLSLFDADSSVPVAFHHVPLCVRGWNGGRSRGDCVEELLAVRVPLIRTPAMRPYADLRVLRDATRLFPLMIGPWEPPTCPFGAWAYHDRLLVFAPEDLPDDPGSLAERAGAIINRYTTRTDPSERYIP